MRIRSNPVVFLLLAVAVVAGLFLVVQIGSRPGIGGRQSTPTAGTNTGKAEPTQAYAYTGPYPTAIPGNTFRFGTRNLVGATPDQIAQFTLDYISHIGTVRGGPPQVLISRYVTRAEFEALALGCMAATDAIEEPPYALVVLKGDFHALKFGPTLQAGDVLDAKYVAIVLDTWVAGYTFASTSLNGAGWQKVIDDPAVPKTPGLRTFRCPTPVPVSQRKRHYGEPKHGVPVGMPPTVPPEVAGRTPTPMPTWPGPVPTVPPSAPVPTPVPTR